VLWRVNECVIAWSTMISALWLLSMREIVLLYSGALSPYQRLWWALKSPQISECGLGTKDGRR
jgi:hypothetical protein